MPTNSDKTGTNAADSAPGVDDGPARNAQPERRLTRGSRNVWVGVIICVLILIAIFLAHPMTRDSGSQMVVHGQTQADLSQDRATPKGGTSP